MMHQLPSFPTVLPALAAVAGGLLFTLSGCAPGSFGVTSGLETDEVYLQRGEAFVTDAEYLAFAMEQAGVSNSGDDYYDADRAAMSARSGRQFTPFSNSLLGMSTPYGTFGTGWGSPYGGFGASPFGMNSWGYNPYGSWGNPYGMGGYNPYGTWGYNPYSMYGYNPYGFNPYGPSWGGGGWVGNNGGWTDNSGFNVTSGPRIPIISSTSVNSNLGSTGLLVEPRTFEERPKLVTNEVMDQALGRNVDLDVVAPPPPPAPRNDSNPWERMLSSPSIPEEFREPYAPSTSPRTEPSYRAPEPSSPGRQVTPPRTPSRPSTTPSRPSTSPNRPSGGSRTPSAPSRSGRGG